MLEITEKSKRHLSSTLIGKNLFERCYDSNHISGLSPDKINLLTLDIKGISNKSMQTHFS